MTRIIAGTAKGQRIEVPTRGTRPTSDRVREALFSSLESWMIAHSSTWQESHFVDLFGGSGAVGLEAASRGASEVTIVEQNHVASKLIRGNANRLGLNVSVIAADAARWMPSSSVNLLYCDPPYSITDLEIQDLVQRILAAPQCADALCVIERGVRSLNPFAAVPPEVLNDTWDRTYGDTRLWYGHVLGGTP